MEEKIIDRIKEIDLANEMKNSFLDYSMSVIVSRAIPDIRDGLKPVHRRIIYTMFEDGYTSDKPYQKSAKSVGTIMGRYHPHGDVAIYESMARMAQEFTYRYMLVDGHGGFGSIDGDRPAAARYTEARLSKISLELIRDINKNTVDFIPSYDGQGKEPVVLPSRYPNILVNGNMGIAVGMATNIPPHNLTEVINGCIAYIENKEITSMELMEYVKGPDFPTSGIILGSSGIRKAYETGRGSIAVRGKAEIQEKNGRYQIIITELPFQVVKKSLIEKIAELVRDKAIDGISDLNDESALEGIKIVIDIKREANAEVVLNNLYKHTQLQTSFGINLLMLVDGRPRTMDLRSIIEKYLDYQREIVYRRTKFELDKAQKRVHILDGLKICLDNIDRIISIIRGSASDELAKEQLIKEFAFNDIQVEAILEMKLRRLTGLEKNKLENELCELLKFIDSLNVILNSEEEIYKVIRNELEDIRNKFGDERKTIIDNTSIDNIEDESLIPIEDIVITLTNKGYIKRITSETYKTQNRGGVGVKGMATNEADFVENIISMTTHDYLMFFTDKGKVYRIKGYEVPLFNRQSKGLPIINLLPLGKEEVVKAMLKIENTDLAKYIVFCTQNGLVKRTNLDEFSNIRSNGKIAITLKENDTLLSVKKTTGESEILIASSNGRMIRFDEKEIRVMGRTASGVRGIDLGTGLCVGCEIADKGQEVLVITEKGYGKKTDIEAYRITHRGSKGVKALNITEKNGNIVSFKTVNGDEDLIIITDSGIVIRLPLEQISSTGRVAQGVKLINLKEDQKASTVAIIKKDDEEIILDSELTLENKQND